MESWPCAEPAPNHIDLKHGMSELTAQPTRDLHHPLRTAHPAQRSCQLISTHQLSPHVDEPAHPLSTHLAGLLHATPCGLSTRLSPLPPALPPLPPPCVSSPLSHVHHPHSPPHSLPDNHRSRRVPPPPGRSLQRRQLHRPHQRLQSLHLRLPRSPALLRQRLQALPAQLPGSEGPLVHLPTEPADQGAAAPAVPGVAVCAVTPALTWVASHPPTPESEGEADAGTATTQGA